MNLDNLLQQIDQEISRLNAVREILRGRVPASKNGHKATTKKKKHYNSPAFKETMRKAMSKRWRIAKKAGRTSLASA